MPTMSEPIRKKSDISLAPTPQNTPSSVTNSYLHSQPPNISTINEEDSDLNKQLINNPMLLSMIQGKLGSLVGKDSGYIQSLSKPIKNRIYGLKSVQKEQMDLENEFQKELLELEKKYNSKYQPLFEKRSKIINGDLEPTEAEIEEGEKLAEFDDELSDNKIEELDENEENTDKDGKDEEKGIPGFWLTCLENIESIAHTITERDAEVLKFLKDIKMEYLEVPGFKLIFEFQENDFFDNEKLTKSYFYQKELGYAGDFIYDHAEGSEISWKLPEKNVTLIIERRKQRNKHTKQTRTIEKLTPTESFFNFFDPPQAPKVGEDDKSENSDDNEDEDDEDLDLDGRLELDYQLGEDIKDRLIPRAIDWFTGEAVDYAFEDEEDEDSEDDESDDDNGDDDDDEDEDDEGTAKQQPPECNQS